ncbi:Thrombospondin-type laminin G domain and EAR repeat-containing protein [Durusdinium trenchii]|uniref:Thrombospondin-type laminin G domain and EAR repeat-containing protein n=1 Tax=Durusdinium trenchii TaxID=1381693 RepID=A0ABP0REA8_9DINO
MWDSASEAAGPMVLDVQSTGAVPKFNQLHPKQAIRPNDVIASIDDESQHAAVLSKLNGPLPDQVKLVVKRPREVKVSLSKPGALGMKLDYQETSIGDHPSDAIGLGDRIAQVNGEKLSGAKLLPKLKAEDKLVLTVLKY